MKALEPKVLILGKKFVGDEVEEFRQKVPGRAVLLRQGLRRCEESPPGDRSSDRAAGLPRRAGDCLAVIGRRPYDTSAGQEVRMRVPRIVSSPRRELCGFPSCGFAQEGGSRPTLAVLDLESSTSRRAGAADHRPPRSYLVETAPSG